MIVPARTGRPPRHTVWSLNTVKQFVLSIILQAATGGKTQCIKPDALHCIHNLGPNGKPLSLFPETNPPYNCLLFPVTLAAPDAPDEVPLGHAKQHLLGQEQHVCCPIGLPDALADVPRLDNGRLQVARA